MEEEEAAEGEGVEEGRQEVLLEELLEEDHDHAAVVQQHRAGRGPGPGAGPEVEELGVEVELGGEEEQD